MRERERMRDNAKLSRHPSSSFIHHQCPPKRHIWRKCRVCCASSSSPSVGWRHRLYVSIHPSSTTLVTHFVVAVVTVGLSPVNSMCLAFSVALKSYTWMKPTSFGIQYDTKLFPSSSTTTRHLLSKDLYPDKSDSIMYHHVSSSRNGIVFSFVRHHSWCCSL